MDTPRHITSRQYPRIPLNNTATLEVIHHLKKPGRWEPQPVPIRTASCEGLGLVFHKQPPEPLLRRDRVRVTLRAGHKAIAVPGHVVWSCRELNGELDVGIRLDLAIAKAEDRRIYSSWVVASIVSLRDELAARG